MVKLINYMKKILSLLVFFSILLPNVASAAIFGFVTTGDLRAIYAELQRIQEQIVELKSLMGHNLLGGVTNPVAGVTYTLSGGGISAVATTITLSSLTIPQTGYELLDSDFSDTFYLTLEPGSRTRQEIVSCTGVTQNVDNTATLSGCVRGLLPYTPFTASSTYAFSHGGGTVVIFSNPPQLYNEFLAAGNTSTITARYTFPSSTALWPRIAASSTNLTGVDTSLLAPIYYVNSVASSGAANANTAVNGLVEIATTAEVASGTASGGTGALLVAPNSIFGSSSTARQQVPVTGTDGKISQGFIDLTQGFAFSGNNTSTGLTTQATTTFSGTIFTNSTSSATVWSRSMLITASTTWVVPVGVTTVFISGVGSGGGGAASGGVNNTGGGGGGSGAWVYRAQTSTTPGTSIVITIGGAGLGGTVQSSTGNAASSTTIGSWITLRGGNQGGRAAGQETFGGAPTSTLIGGIPVNGSATSTIPLTSSPGGPSSGNAGGDGGSALFPILGLGGLGGQTSSDAGATSTVGCGGGGGGGGGGNANNWHPGAAGKTGCVLIEW